jgi:hypothetical protein
MNIMRNGFKKIAENNAKFIEIDLGDLLNKIWEVVRASSQVIDNCLKVQSISDNKKQTVLLLILRNMLSDCCCCLDSLERGHERTIFNNLRMILEDLSAVMHASENENVYTALQDGKHQASQSVTFATKRSPGHEFGRIYGLLSKISHHMEPGLIVRQWINRDGLIAHIKPYDPNRHQEQLNALLMIMLLAGLTGETAEELCLDELETPYFWTKGKERHPSPAIKKVISEVAEKIDRIMPPPD